MKGSRFQGAARNPARGFEVLKRRLGRVVWSCGRAAPSCGAEGFDVWDAADVPPMTTAPSSVPWGTEGSNYLAKTAQEKHRGFAKNKKRRGYRSFFINLGDGGFVFVCRIGPETHGGFEKKKDPKLPRFARPIRPKGQRPAH